MKYSSRRITISYFAAVKVCKQMGLPVECKPQTLASALEKMIFENGCNCANKDCSGAFNQVTDDENLVGQKN